jgi:hypothetical protein
VYVYVIVFKNCFYVDCVASVSYATFLLFVCVCVRDLVDWFRACIVAPDPNAPHRVWQ